MIEGNVDNQSLNSDAQKDEYQSVFSLKKSNASSTAPFISVDFSLPSSLKQNPSFSSINLIPTFNSDGKFYTPSFILGSELSKYVANDEGYRMIHQKKIQEIDQQRLEILVPKPSKANSYCCICKAPFQDYLTHVNIPKHKQTMRKSPYCKLITDLCARLSCPGPLESSEEIENEKTENLYMAKKKKIIKITSSKQEKPFLQAKRGRGRPRKNICAKIQMLVSIPTNVSISL